MHFRDIVNQFTVIKAVKIKRDKYTGMNTVVVKGLNDEGFYELAVDYKHLSVAKDVAAKVSYFKGV